MSDIKNNIAIDVQNLSIGYESRVLLQNLNFSVNSGEIFVILGGSGCGKSSLLKNLFGLYQPLAGDVFIEGQNITKAIGVDRQKIMTSFGVMYQEGALFGSMNLLDNVTLFMEEYTKLTKQQMQLLARCKLDLVGLLPYESYMPSEISGGMQKRAAIARAMALDPKILFLDEPSAGLDPITSADLDSTILDLSRNLGFTFVIVSHELASIYAIADKVIMLDKDTKGIIAEGDPKVLRDTSTNPQVHQFFNRIMSKEAA
ncbi:phospholipid/cholesterol/gamma-HCH transport system ATP-binding protein [Polynucleobacter sphagniphilus]|jgi:phospholipid/cholesterol/gamma-HCH transport system ATP-binding protein|uniref:Phospholipid/cholesterol/gamma-HCH transport system ATP-binding protein n=1 Tax=Polynucleobacter sphagniphilus TaxID=1743169 RepID=A0AA43M8H3_9BURK|nr:ATP-binding cassette domain-containing protein [Polynucleobacter sphagniphilus]MDH6242216.1 phospholipid/cholesterol/gamma-HCH transport system ATP-binding protein [Polynucleobacter sphagniphilus]MDH6302650.1 phospholipid/cholesterol/gamma-HCH transport system ATP-binding protein [Polynucleobacter sphagniphilus]MDH6503585.1 phospholipid/cholesterol/gamma-HCH transport system ATP-binding protein [Polynucleobacter sphagniphilus]MDH6512234.1 phospholipid/cholesterol/gamma-HCH transport system A